MTQKDKELLLKDLSARLPYGVKLDFYSSATNEHIVCTLLGIEPEGDKPIIAKVDCGAFMFQQDHIKPYLRPMSSMTEEENEEFEELFISYSISQDRNCVYHSSRGDLNLEIIDWLNAHYFDYRGLIEKGLALEAKEGMYEKKKA